MNISYVRIIRFVSWLFKEIIRLTKEGTEKELDILVDMLESARHYYKIMRQRLKEK